MNKSSNCNQNNQPNNQPYSHTQKHMKKHLSILLILLVAAAMSLASCHKFDSSEASPLIVHNGENATNKTQTEAEAEAKANNKTQTQTETQTEAETPTETPTPTPKPAGLFPLDQTNPEALALYFIENSLSYHGKVLPSGSLDPTSGSLDPPSGTPDPASETPAQTASEILDPASENYKNALTWQQNLINERRTSFNNQQVLTDVTIESKNIWQSSDLALVSLKTLETYQYLDEPELPGQVRSAYHILLRKQADKWQVAWSADSSGLSLLAHGIGELGEAVKTRPYFSQDGLYFPFIAEGTLESLDNLDLSAYNTDAVLQAIQNFPYADLGQIAETERQLIAQEKAALAENLPQRSATAEEGLSSFDREAMSAYINKWAMARNDNWGDFSPYGGDCQNFASQVILSGGASMDEGEGCWFFNSFDSRSPAWSSVPSMEGYLVNNIGKGPHGVSVKSWTELQVGDLLQINWDQNDRGDHSTVLILAGKQARLAGHTTDALNQRVSDVMGEKILLHLTGYQP